jgi:hypothetical protein
MYILGGAGTEYLTPDWLLERMGERSFGLTLLLLSVFGLLPEYSPPCTSWVTRSRCSARVLGLYFPDAAVAANRQGCFSARSREHNAMRA